MCVNSFNQQACLLGLAACDDCFPAALLPCPLQLLDEIGVDLSAAMGSAPQRKVAAAQSSKAAAAAADEESELQDLAARLAMLRN